MSYRPLGDDSDFPADPEQIRDYGESVAATGALILEQVALLQSLARGDCWVADTADAFREQAQDLAQRIEQASGRYVTVGNALTTVADDLRDYERRAADRAQEAQSLQWTVAANPEASPEPAPDGGPPAMTPEGAAQNQRRQHALDRIEVLQGEFDWYVEQARDAAGTAAGTIKGALEDDVADNWWERNAGWLGQAKTVLGWAAAVAGVALAIVAAIATAPVWLVVLAVGLAAAALVISVGLAVRAGGSWVDVAFDAVGVLSLGAGAAFARAAAKAFPAVRSAVAGSRATQAHRARYALEAPGDLTELRRYASVAGDTTGNSVAARQLLAQVRTEARSAAAAARGATLASFPVTRVQRFFDGGLDASRVHRQAGEMLLDLRTMPVPPPAGLLGNATRLSRLSTVGVVATNVGAGSQVTQTVVDPDWRSGGNLNLLTDLVQRVR